MPIVINGAIVGEGDYRADLIGRVASARGGGHDGSTRRDDRADRGPEQKLTSWARAATTPQRLARRARIILGSAAGLGSRRLAQQERMSRTTVQRWRARFVATGSDGLENLQGVWDAAFGVARSEAGTIRARWRHDW